MFYVKSVHKLMFSLVTLPTSYIKVKRKLTISKKMFYPIYDLYFQNVNTNSTNAQKKCIFKISLFLFSRNLLLKILFSFLDNNKCKSVPSKKM